MASFSREHISINYGLMHLDFISFCILLGFLIYCEVNAKYSLRYSYYEIIYILSAFFVVIIIYYFRKRSEVSFWRMIFWYHFKDVEKAILRKFLPMFEIELNHNCLNEFYTLGNWVCSKIVCLRLLAVSKVLSFNKKKSNFTISH